MKKVLWADDQTEIVKTFSHLLVSLNLNITYVKNGTEAVAALEKSKFDVLILDLRMPPETWGGLWLLEKINTMNIRIPTIVLSGEGAQSETVAAMRLGADDYIQKNNIEKELLSRIIALLDNKVVDIGKSGANELPSLFAIPLQRYLASTSPPSRLKRLIEFYELGLRSCGIIGCCELNNISNKYIPNFIAFKILQGPSMGDWVELCQLLQKELDKESGFKRLYSCFDCGITDSLIRLRNDISHGIEPSIKGADAELDKWSVEINNLITRLLQTKTIDFIIPSSLNYDGDNFQIVGHKMIGCSTSLPGFKIESKIPIVSGHPYINIRKMNINTFISLYPLLIVEPTVTPEVSRILLYDSASHTSTGHKPSGEESLRYFDLWTGERRVSPSINVTSKLLPQSIYKLISN